MWIKPFAQQITSACEGDVRELPYLALFITDERYTDCMLFCLLILTLAEEFAILYRIIGVQVSSPPTDIGTWEQLRFRHEALFSPCVPP